MPAQEPRSPDNPRSHRPRVLDSFRTVRLTQRPIGGGLPFWPFNRTRIVERPIAQVPPLRAKRER